MEERDTSSADSMSTLRNPCGSQAVVCSRGAQLISWIHAGTERLYMSPQAVLRPAHPIRGGVPVIFPQFGDRGPGLRHGFARLATWTPVNADQAAWLLTETEQSLLEWPHRFRAELEIQLHENQLSTSLTITNRDKAEFFFTGALHTYLRVSNIEHAALSGLQGCPYLDATKGRLPHRQHEQELRFDGEVDRIYPDSGRDLILRDSSSALRIRSSGFTDTVVWNPGAELAARTSDLGVGNHAHFVCVEAASVETLVRLAPGATWRGQQTLVCLDG